MVLPPERLSDAKEQEFPNLARSSYSKTSDETPIYNCVAFALGRDDVWIEPVSPPRKGIFWPSEVPKDYTVSGYIRLFEHYGFIPCSDSRLETGFKKVAIFNNNLGLFSHVALQLMDGRWTSKLGDWEDIEHDTLFAVEDAGERYRDYGQARTFLKLPI